MKHLWTIAPWTITWMSANVLASAPAEIDAYLRAFEESARAKSQGAEHFLSGRLTPLEKSATMLQTQAFLR
jgi:hypothetical protein